MGLGMRVYYDVLTNNIVSILSEVDGLNNVRNKEEISYIDVPYGFDFTKSTITGVDHASKTVLIESIPETEEQKQIRELEDALLLQAEKEVGGIL